jgi:ubiquinone/menaquinone biosynthesis C-methylase UbiE
LNGHLFQDTHTIFPEQPLTLQFYHAVEVERIVGDEDGKLPFEDKSLDLVMSSMSLHWSNKIEGVLTEVKRVLKPDGVFLGAMLGGETLHELKYVHFCVGMHPTIKK